MTINTTRVNHSEADTGSIEVGKSADLAVPGRDLFDTRAEEISKTQVLMTLFGGEIVYEAAPTR